MNIIERMVTKNKQTNAVVSCAGKTDNNYNNNHNNNVQETEVWPDKQMVYAQPTICPREWYTNSYGILRYKWIT